MGVADWERIQELFDAALGVDAALTNVASSFYQYPRFFAQPRRFMLGATASF